MSNICIICVSLRAGGTERVISNYANRLAARHRISIIVLSGTEPFYQLDHAIKVFRPRIEGRSHAGWRWYPRTIAHVGRHLKQVRPDLVLCFGETIAPAILPITTILGCRNLVFNRASPLSSLRGKRAVLNPLAYPLAHRVVVQTQRAADMMRGRYRMSKFAVLPNPVETPKHVPKLEKRAQRIINVGTLGGKKNQQALIHAYSELEHRESWQLDFVGDGPARSGLEELVERLGVQKTVRFLSQRQDVDQLLQDSRIFAFSSLTEGFPNALAEALAAGCACLSYDCPTGPAELIENGVNGILVPNNDEAAFRHSLAELTNDAGLQGKLAAAARARIMQFDAELIFAQFQQLIEECLPRKTGPPKPSCES